MEQETVRGDERTVEQTVGRRRFRDGRPMGRATDSGVNQRVECGP